MSRGLTGSRIQLDARCIPALRRRRRASALAPTSKDAARQPHPHSRWHLNLFAQPVTVLAAALWIAHETSEEEREEQAEETIQEIKVPEYSGRALVEAQA